MCIGQDRINSHKESKDKHEIGYGSDLSVSDKTAKIFIRNCIVLSSIQNLKQFKILCKLDERNWMHDKISKNIFCIYIVHTCLLIVQIISNRVQNVSNLNNSIVLSLHGRIKYQEWKFLGFSCLSYVIFAHARICQLLWNTCSFTLVYVILCDLHVSLCYLRWLKNPSKYLL